MHHSWKKSPRLKSPELKRKFIGHLGDENFRIRELIYGRIGTVLDSPVQHNNENKFHLCQQRYKLHRPELSISYPYDMYKRFQLQVVLVIVIVAVR